MLRERHCNKSYYECGKASFRTDDKGYPFGIKCLKHSDFVDIRDAKREKEFQERGRNG